MKTAIPVEEAARRIPDGASLLIGGFMGVSAPPIASSTRCSHTAAGISR